MNTETQIRQILDELPKHYEDPNWLSKCAIQLSTLLYNLGDEMAEAELAENTVIVSYLDQTAVDAKKPSVAESEKRGVVETNNLYGKLKLKYQSVTEAIQSIKKRLDSQSQQMKVGV